MKNRIFSLLIIIIYLIGAYILGGSEFLLKMAFYLILPFFCIWFGDEMGQITGLFGGIGMRPAITEKSPGCLVIFMGWILLLLPIIIFIFQSITNSI